MKRLAFAIAVCLLSGAAYGDFELKDPALIDEEELNTPVAKEIRNYAVEGAGVKSCGSYQADRKKNGSMHYIDLNWAKGFITGVNFIHAETKGNPQLGGGLDLDALTLWIDNYCRNNPQASLSDASSALVNELMN